MTHKKAFIAAVDIVTVEPDATGIHVISATNRDLSLVLAGQHYDDAISAEADISEKSGRPVRLRMAANTQNPAPL